jgi:uncharacterized protein YdeI (BOF family)
VSRVHSVTAEEKEKGGLHLFCHYLESPGRASEATRPPEVLQMNTLKSKLILSVSACALALATTSAWGSGVATNSATPMLVIQEPQAPPAQAQSDQAAPNQDSSKSTTFTGTVMKDGEQYVLRDASGSVYKLDDSSRAQSFEGKAVKITGRLDASAKMIHVDSIQAIAS